jgi:uncharacterized protein (DUF2141 family)
MRYGVGMVTPSLLSSLVVIVSLSGLFAAPRVSPERPLQVSGTVHFEGKGKVYVDLVTEAAFHSSSLVKPYLAIDVGPDEAARGWVPFVFKGVASGRYALRSFQDENGNGVLDTSLLGPPSEPWGMYRPSRPLMRGPRFEECAFELTADRTDIRITVR